MASAMAINGILCQSCKKAFNTSGNIPARRFPAQQVGAAIGMYYNGMSYKQIAENMEDMFRHPRAEQGKLSMSGCGITVTAHWPR